MTIILALAAFVVSLFLTWHFWFVAESGLLAVACALSSLGMLAGIAQFLLGTDRGD